MASKEGTFTGISWVLLAAWAAAIAILASYFYSKNLIRKVTTLMEGLEKYVEVNVPR